MKFTRKKNESKRSESDVGSKHDIQYACPWGFVWKTWLWPSNLHWRLSAEIQGNLGDKNRKCFGTSNFLVTEFVCWKQFWSNSTSKVGGRPSGMRMLELVGVRPRPVWEAGGHSPASGKGKESEETPGKCSDDALFCCGGFIYSKVNPAYCNPFAEVSRVSLDTAQSSESTAKPDLPWKVEFLVYYFFSF